MPTPYQDFHINHTETSADEAYDKRNLMVLSRHPILDSRQVRNEYVGDLMYRRIIAHPTKPMRNRSTGICGDFNAEPGQVPVEAIAGWVENTGNAALAQRQLLPCSNTIPREPRYSHLHEGHGKLLDHMLISHSLLAYYQNTEIYNEMLHDESIVFA